MPGSQTSKPSWWAIFLGRSPPVPPIPPGGWTRESIREFWRQRIATSPQDAPLSHAALADLLRTRGTFQNWVWWDKGTIAHEPLGPEASFVKRIRDAPSLIFILFFLVSWPVFYFASFLRNLYSMIFILPDTLCVVERSLFAMRPFRCDAFASAIDLAFVSSLLVPIFLTMHFLRRGGAAVFVDHQRTKKYIQNGGIGFPFVFLAILLTPLSWGLNEFLIGQRLIHPIIVPGLAFLPGLWAWSLFVIWHCVKAGYAMIFFYITGRFPSWLEDLSP